MQLYLIRHAQSTNNALEDFKQRVADPALTPKGEEQTRRLAAYLPVLKDFTPTHLYCSAMLRALQTAYPLAQALNMPLQVWVDIHEGGGIYLEDPQTKQMKGYTGMTRAEIAARFPEVTMDDAVTENGWWRPERGMESHEELLGRAIRVASALLRRAESDDHIVLVSHGLFLDILIKAFFNQLPSLPRGLFYLHYNTAMSRLDFNEHPDTLRIHFLNRVDHLPSELWSA